MCSNRVLILAATEARLLGKQPKSQAVNEDEGLEQKRTSYRCRSHGDVLLLDSNQVSYLLS